MVTARDWLIAGAPGASTSIEVFAGTCERLLAEGVPVGRGEAYVRTLHPQFAGRTFEWTPAFGCRALEAAHTQDLDAATAPLRHVFLRGESYRHRIARREDDPYLGMMCSLGMVEVLALPMVFTSGEIHAVAFATREGFSDGQLAALEAIAAPLSRMAEILALRRTAANVVSAYVGRDAGARVLAGKIRRGDTELIECAIWFSDMRGFSARSNEQSPREVIDMLNELFDCQVPTIEEQGGEVLKFIGDGLLAIFVPRPGEVGLGACCTRALAACRASLATLAARNAGVAEPLRFGIALHVGEVAYGNIGAANRLDFTCIGRAINLAARIETLTGETGRDVLASEAFATLCGGFVAAGEHRVKGFATPVAVFAPASG
ncbi:MAG: adenylate/guanylate cyclase domain-containing protein [Myxococcales bacterium]|nr:adenylate/guanylate cyclase domain-containing protein [Myxococcales bacterium]